MVFIRHGVALCKLSMLHKMRRGHTTARCKNPLEKMLRDILVFFKADLEL
jgi:hypothetical protein